MLVAGPPDAPGPHPGLLLEWRRSPGVGWQARVVWVVEADEVVVQQWVDAALVRPATG